MYFNKNEINWRLSQCCQFHTTKKYTIGTVSKTYSLKADGKNKVQSKALTNAHTLKRTLQEYFSKLPINLRSFRISSELFPCYTLEHTKEWYKEINPQLSTILSEAGDIAKKHEIRLSMHPAQFTVLASNKSSVVSNSIQDLEYHANIGKMLGLPAEDFTVNIHLQGLYGGSRQEGINRFATHFDYLSDYTKQCLAVENEDKHKSGYDIEHTLILASKIPTRCTLDIHHYECFRQKQTKPISHTDIFFKEAVKTWKHVRPLFHVSQTKLDEYGNDVARTNQHSDILHDLYRLEILTPMLTYADFDIEAKFKEVAVANCYNFIKEEEYYSGQSLI